MNPCKKGRSLYISCGGAITLSILNINAINITTIKINNEGVKKCPILFTNLPGFKHNHNTIPKKAIVYKSINIVLLAPSGRYGNIAISKGTEPALGIPNPGPIDT